jgi:hypothetical protein
MSHRTVCNMVTNVLLFAGIGLGMQTACVSEGGDFGGTGGASGAGAAGRATAAEIGTRTQAGRECSTLGKGTVKCGDSTCASSTQACCLDAYAGTAACIDSELFCGTPTSTGAPATCDEKSDCPQGESCCLHSGAGYLSIMCMPDSECPGDSPYIWNRVLCASPAEQLACPPDETCTPWGGAIPLGWSVCTR